MSTPTETPLPDELALPHFEDALWAELADLLDALPAPHRDRRRGRRLGLMAAAAVVVAAVIAAAVAFGADPGSTPPASAEVVARIDRATRAAAGDMILHAVSHDMLVGTTEDVWYDPVTTASRVRIATLAGRPTIDVGSLQPPGVHDRRPAGPRLPEGCLPFAADPPGRNLRSHQCPPELEAGPHAGRAVNHCTGTYADFGPGHPAPDDLVPTVEFFHPEGWALDGTRVVDGRRLIRLRSGGAEMVVDPDTYLPVRVVEGRADEGGVFETDSYEWLTRTPEHLARLSPPIPAGFRRTAQASACDVPAGRFPPTTAPDPA